jgi:diguanylate cyclase (GGDEF)-like protein/PAS domain S-box-containing protein
MLSSAEEISLPDPPDRASEELRDLHRTLSRMLDTVIEKRRAMINSVVDLERRIDEKTSDLHDRSARLRQRERMLSEVINRAPVAMALLDHRMCFVATSQRWLSEFGLEQSEIVGLSFTDVFPLVPGPCRIAQQHALSGNAQTYTEDSATFGLSNGRRFRINVLPWRNDKGEVGGVIMVSDDVTHQNLINEQLKDRGGVLDRFNAIVTQGGVHPEERIRLLLALGCDVLSVSRGWVFERRHNQSSIRAMENRDTILRMSRKSSADLASHLLDAAQQDDAPYLTYHDVETRARLIDEEFSETVPSACLAVPFEGHHEHPEGMICFADSAQRRQPFSEFEVAFARMLAAWVSSIGSLEEVEHRASVNRRRLENLARSVGPRILIVDEQAHVRVMGSGFEDFGMDVGEALNQPVSRLLGNSAERSLEPALKQALAGRPAMTEITVDGVPARDFSVRLLPDRSDPLHPAAVLILEERVATSESVEGPTRILRDPLTGLTHRRSLNSLLASSHPQAVLALRLDNQEDLIQQFGRAALDTAVIAVARCMQETCGRSDAGVHLGGGEFLILTAASPARAAVLAEELLDAIRDQSIRHGQHRFTITASIGVAACSDDFEQAFAAADQAASAVALSGGDQVAKHWEI